jgi:NAD(P)H-flavin reductase/ferredoxin
MPKQHRIVVNGEAFSATRGDVLLDAALAAGIDMPHDCRAGQCGSCAVSLVDGSVWGGESSEPGMVLACQCRVISDAELAVEDTPVVDSVSGVVTGMTPLAPDIVEVRIKLVDPVEYLPGQYFRLRFQGFPERCYSPTMPLDRPGDGRKLYFHIRRMADGRVSPAVGTAIRKGHRVKLTGPFGSAYLRPHLDNRLVLVATGTGFAPIWSLACDAISENPEREMIVVAGAQSIESLYMVPALCRLAQYPNVRVIPTTSTPQTVSRVVRHGRPTEHLPSLSPEDIVYVCGAPLMVEAVKEIARGASAVFYADPFVAQGDDEDSLLSRALGWITGSTATKPVPPQERRPAQPGRPALVATQGDRWR